MRLIFFFLNATHSTFRAYVSVISDIKPQPQSLFKIYTHIVAALISQASNKMSPVLSDNYSDILDHVDGQLLELEKIYIENGQQLRKLSLQEDVLLLATQFCPGHLHKHSCPVVLQKKLPILITSF